MGDNQSPCEEEFKALLSLVEHLPLGAILLAGSGRILAINPRAKRILGRDRWTIPNALGELALSGDAAEVLLPAWLLENPAEPVMCEGRSTGQVIEAVLIPIPDGGVDDLVALLMWDPDLIAEFVEMRFAKAYGLTRAESDVVRSLAETGDIVAYCERRNVGIEAARGHLKAAFRKTNCDSRAKLLSLLFQNWALYGGFAGRNAH